MSYDIEVFTRNIHLEENYTSNVYPMYDTAYKIAQAREKEMKEDGEIKWCDLTCEDFTDALNSDRETAIRALSLMLNELTKNPDIYKSMNPENDWGNYEGAVHFLQQALTALTTHKDAEMRIDC